MNLTNTIPPEGFRLEEQEETAPDVIWSEVVDTLDVLIGQVKYLAPERFDDETHERDFYDTLAEAERVAEMARNLLTKNANETNPTS